MPNTRTRGSHEPPRRTPREHRRVVQDCVACDLHRSRRTPVIGDGPDDARLVVVGAAPRRHEDLQGSALAGAPRNVLDEALGRAGLRPAEVRVTDVVRCRPPEDRAPLHEELRACAAHLDAELTMVDPEVIVTLGELATAVVLGRPVPLARVAGYRLDVRQGVTLVPTHHPAEVVRGVPEAAKALRRDLAVAKAVLDGRMGTGAEALSELRSRLAAQG